MKFGHEIEAEASELPEAFRPFLLPYKSMKKLVKNIVFDLESQGLAPLVLASNIENPSDSRIKYVLGSAPHHEMSQMFISTNGDNSSNEKHLQCNNISELMDTQERFDSHVVIPSDLARSLWSISDNLEDTSSSIDSLLQVGGEKETFFNSEESCFGTVTVRLKSDAEFFEHLDSAIRRITEFQAEHLGSNLEKQLGKIGEQLRDAAGPNSQDRNKWRGLLQLYLESGMAIQLGRLTADQCVDLLVRFVGAALKALQRPGFDFDTLSVADMKEIRKSSEIQELEEEGLSTCDNDKTEKKHWVVRLWSLCCNVRKIYGEKSFYSLTKDKKNEVGFNSKKGWQLLSQFIRLNGDIIALRRLMQLTHTAVGKIVKKHDKKTGLPSRTQWVAIAPRINATGFLRDCMQLVAESLQRVAPPLSDHICPVCLEIAYPAVRLPICGHIFCRNCIYTLALNASIPKTSSEARAIGIPNDAIRLPALVLLHRYPNIPDISLRCPLCRFEGGGVSRTTLQKIFIENTDENLCKFLKEYFGDLVKVKKRDIRRRVAKDESEFLSYTLLPLSR